MVLKLCLCSRRNISPGNPEGADQPRKDGLKTNTVDQRTDIDQDFEEVGMKDI